MLPSHAIDRLFDRFTMIYGAQKTAQAWGGVHPDDRNRVWREALGKYPLQAVGDAVRDLAEHGNGWPPTLPEFVALVRDSVRRPEHQHALPAPARTEQEIAAGAALARKAVAAVTQPAGNDRARWAYRVLERIDAREDGIAAMTETTALRALHNLGRTPPEHWAERFERVNRFAAA
jgi:hypothetical protein